MKSMTRIVHCINLIWITNIEEQKYIMTAKTVIKFQIGLQ